MKSPTEPNAHDVHDHRAQPYVSDFRRPDFDPMATDPYAAGHAVGHNAVHSAGHLNETERTPALVTHLSPLLGLVLPGIGNFLGPLAAWLIFRDRSSTLDAQGREALNFQISMWIYSLVGGVILFGLGALGLLGGLAGAAAGSGVLAGFGLLSGAGLLLLGALLGVFLVIIPMVCMILAAMSVSSGKPYRYPLTLRLL